MTDTMEAMKERITQLVSRPWRPRVGGRRQELPARTRKIVGTLSVVVAVGLWQAVASAHMVNPLIISSPVDVIQAARDLWREGLLEPALISTGSLFAFGFGVSLVAGLTLGVLFGWYNWVDAIADPFISIFYAAPRIALIPLIIVWFGLGVTSKVVIVISTAIFPIIMNTAAALKATDRQLILVARSYRATNLMILRTIALPGSVPLVIAGVRQGVAMALIGVVVAEYFLGTSGVGGLINAAGQNAETAEVFVGLIIFAIAALLFNAILRMIERRFDAWRL